MGPTPRLAALALVGVALSGCAWFKSEPPPPCPRVSILSDAARLVQFRPGPGRDLTDVEFEAEIVAVASSCTYRDNMRRVVVTASAQIVAQQGPAASGKSANVPFFVAIAEGDERVLAKSRFDSRIDFPEGRRRAGVAEETEQNIPLPAGRTGRDFDVLVGLQLSADQLQYMRSQQRR
jgi:hypothetical protein